MERAEISNSRLVKKKKQIATPADGALVVTVDQASIMLAIGRVSVYKLLRAGQLECRHFGRATRITLRSINNLINENV